MKNDIAYKSICVWSAGENGKTKKKEMVYGYILSVLYAILIVTIFICSEQKTIWGRLGETFCLGVLISLVGFLGPAMVKSSLEAIRRNKFIELRLYDIKDFSLLGGVPENMYVAFADSRGVVLCESKYERQCHDWIGFSSKIHFHDFENYYEKHCKKETAEAVLST